MAAISLIVGLGNPGAQYEETRHNAGFQFLERVRVEYGLVFKLESRFNASAAKANVNGEAVWCIAPNTYMNHSGRSVAPFANYYRIPANKILVVHDELDLPPGTVRLKIGGGHGGHNGLRDIVGLLSSSDFARLRIGIGHPGNSREVTNYVLRKASAEDRISIDQAIQRAAGFLPAIIAGDFARVMNELHRNETEEK